jgi:NAD(P)-dependent dehydrogenase (short-subunit alcohol dehydrogenase family)
MAAFEREPRTKMAKVAIITGGGSGIGHASALALAKAGWTIVVAGRRAQLLQETVEVAGGDGFALTCDMADPAAVRRLFDKTQERFGRLDLLFNNAGHFPRPNPVDEIPLADWQQAVAVNLTGYFLATQHAFRIMKAQEPQGGRIINNGSISATTPRMHAAAYTATKHAVTGLTKSTSLDGRAYNIACGQIDIGNAASEMTSAFTQGMLQADGTRRPEPVMNMKDVADAVVYMASLPLDANVQFMTVMATSMPFIGRG